MFNNSIEIAFKKLLGKGRAWLTPTGFMSDFLGLLASTFEDIKTRLVNLKYTHFPTTNLDINDIVNGEELFSITEIEGKTLEERAANVEGQWSVFGGQQTFKQIENILRKKGFDVRIIENIPQNYNVYGARIIGNGFIRLNSGKSDPVIITNYKHSFIVQNADFWDDNVFLNIVDEIAKSKPGHNTALYIPRYLRKKEIHQKMTKSEMQKYKKSQFCDVRRENGY